MEKNTSFWRRIKNFFTRDTPVDQPEGHHHTMAWHEPKKSLKCTKCGKIEEVDRNEI